ncbi:nucleotidyl transferase AbiEii/AbiGii toxin family protein [Galbibacter pacificus]|uniref:Nucleotidyl transferase AbiEii/AbiGii toxin family protein n=1 Tax=Galbibacter pacificus TaxID=2996052 RepID=A0ABT6FMY7_9FLAO|nr:nucleotidyl transferase AbiEii/AbiGii toxin family protein [Galbibacter pacificus]MDG3581140.1 nucleotidyl transferase AbiEii/AbiGii toxin family protein [Galbibacter pacificus]MDG3584618.1 nucleotidyl transferase AbiEii/AbiGii toxin family protein [Galbibacter pacificus]
MKLHLDKKLFRQAVQFTSDQMQIPATFIEKDYWVTYTLFTIFNDKIGSNTVFKGGTALSKCYNIIERFSEDIDLIVLRRAGESNNKLTTKIRTISNIVSDVLPEIKIAGLTHKMGMNRKTAHSYNKEFKGDYGQVRDVIVVEATWLGYFEPYTTKSVCSFVGEMMINNGQNEMAEEQVLLPFNVLVLEPSRTICEKIMSLVRFSYGEDPITDLRNKIRHVYDLNQLLSVKELLTFFKSNEFDTMLLKVAQDDVISFKNNNEWLKNHPVNSLIFEKPEKVWDDLKSVYESDFKNLVYGSFPKETALLSTLILIQKRIAAINWNIKFEN